MATIRKRRLTSGQEVWELTHGTGADRQRFVAGKTEEEARHVLDQFERQLAVHGRAPRDGSVDQAVGLFAEFLKTNRRVRTAKRYLRVLRTFNECFLKVHAVEVTQLRQIRPQHVEEFKRLRLEGHIREAKSEAELEREAHLRREIGENSGRGTKRGRYGWLGRHALRSKVTPRTINYELQVITTFFYWAIKRNLLFLNPAQRIDRLRIPKRALPKFLTAEELKRLLAATDEDDRRLFMTIFLTGMRKGEVEHLCWSDISFELGVVFIQEKPDMNWKPKTDERLIPISPVLAEVLRLQLERRTSETLVFPNRSGKIDTHILARLKSACQRAGIRPSTVHALRHSFGAHLRMAGVSLADIGDLLGHSDLATTQIYARVHQEHLRNVVTKLTPLAGDVNPTTPDKSIPEVIDSPRPPTALLGE